MAPIRIIVFRPKLTSLWFFKIVNRRGELIATSMPFDSQEQAHKMANKLRWLMFISSVSDG